MSRYAIIKVTYTDGHEADRELQTEAQLGPVCDELEADDSVVRFDIYLHATSRERVTQWRNRTQDDGQTT